MMIMMMVKMMLMLMEMIMMTTEFVMRQTFSVAVLRPHAHCAAYNSAVMGPNCWHIQVLLADVFTCLSFTFNCVYSKSIMTFLVMVNVCVNVAKGITFCFSCLSDSIN